MPLFLHSFIVLKRGEKKNLLGDLSNYIKCMCKFFLLTHLWSTNLSDFSGFTQNHCHSPDPILTAPVVQTFLWNWQKSSKMVTLAMWDFEVGLKIVWLKKKDMWMLLKYAFLLFCYGKYFEAMVYTHDIQKLEIWKHNILQLRLQIWLTWLTSSYLHHPGSWKL